MKNDPLQNMTRAEVLAHAHRLQEKGRTDHCALAYTEAGIIRAYAERRWPNDHRAEIIAMADKIEAERGFPGFLNRVAFLECYGIAEQS